MFFREPETWFADNTEWTSPGSKMWQDFYISPRIANKATIGGALGNFGSADNSGTTPSIDSAGNISPVGGSNSGQYPFGGSYPGILPAGGSTGAYPVPQANSSGGNAASVTANPSETANPSVATAAPAAATNLSAANAADGDAELVRSATRIEASLTDGENGLLSPASMDAVTNSYQAAGGMLLAQASPGKLSSGETGRQDLESRIVARTDRISSEPTPVVWISNLNGHTVQVPVDSAPQGANPTIDQGWAPDQSWIPGVGWSAGTGDDTGGGQTKNSVPWWQNLPIDNPAPQSSTDPVSPSSPDPAPQSAPSPVPEPSQVVLMVTVIALTALAAKRSAAKRRFAA